MIPDSLSGDEVHIRQVLTNLLNNALKYTSEGSILFSIRREPAISAGDTGEITLVFAVRDTGIGIRSEDLDRLFEKFGRVDMSRNSSVEGTGLGLAITKNLLDMMNGTIQVESVYGVGSVFTVRLPQKVLSSEPLGNFQYHFEKNTLSSATYKAHFHAPTARILVVDDTRMNLMVVTGLLKETQILIDTASSGSEAIQLASKTRYDLILVDQRMPEMDGIETMKHIRTYPNGLNSQIAFICLTADAVTGARERYLAAGFSDYLTKPIDSLALEQMLMRYLPQEKLILQQNTEKEDAPSSMGDAAQSKDIYASLRQAGVNPQIGLRYCQNDSTLYQSVLWEYASSSGSKLAALQQDYDSLDWKNYAILVHALKSSSRIIGATVLSDIALHLENAANDGNINVLRAEHPAMVTRYTMTVNAIQAAGFVEDDPSLYTEEDGILEFMPVSTD